MLIFVRFYKIYEFLYMEPATETKALVTWTHVLGGICFFAKGIYTYTPLLCFTYNLHYICISFPFSCTNGTFLNSNTTAGCYKIATQNQKHYSIFRQVFTMPSSLWQNQTNFLILKFYFFHQLLEKFKDFQRLAI